MQMQDDDFKKIIVPDNGDFMGKEQGLNTFFTPQDNLEDLDQTTETNEPVPERDSNDNTNTSDSSRVEQDPLPETDESE